MQFSAVVEFSDGENQTFDFEISGDESVIVYDDVEDAVYKAVEKEYSVYEGDDIDYKIVDVVLYKDGVPCPVVSDDKTKDELKREFSPGTKILILGRARYALTPECKLWLELKDAGIIDEDTPFEFDKYHEMVKKGLKYA